jgi:hypothetical protein
LNFEIITITFIFISIASPFLITEQFREFVMFYSFNYGLHGLILFCFWKCQRFVLRSEFLAANPEVPGSIPDATRFSE